MGFLFVENTITIKIGSLEKAVFNCMLLSVLFFSFILKFPFTHAQPFVKGMFPSDWPTILVLLLLLQKPIRPALGLSCHSNTQRI